MVTDPDGRVTGAIGYWCRLLGLRLAWSTVSSGIDVAKVQGQVPHCVIGLGLFINNSDCLASGKSMTGLVMGALSGIWQLAQHSIEPVQIGGL